MAFCSKYSPIFSNVHSVDLPPGFRFPTKTQVHYGVSIRPRYAAVGRYDRCLEGRLWHPLLRRRVREHRHDVLGAGHGFQSEGRTGNGYTSIILTEHGCVFAPAITSVCYIVPGMNVL